MKQHGRPSVPAEGSEPLSNPRGRPRNPETDLLVLKAARAVLLNRGYSGFTVEEVSRTAQVAKTSIYLRWPGGRPALVLAAAFHTEVTPPLATKDPVADLLNAAGAIALEMATPPARLAIAGILSELSSSEEVRSAAEEFFSSRRESLMNLFNEARSAYELSDGLSAQIIADAVLGLCVYRSATHQKLSRRHTSALIRTLLAGAGFE